MRSAEALAALQLREGAGLKEIRDAYLRLARLAHPDLAAPERRLAAEAEFKTLQHAYSVATERCRAAISRKHASWHGRVHSVDDLRGAVQRKRTAEPAGAPAGGTPFRAAARSAASSAGRGKFSAAILLAIFTTPLLVAAPFMKRRYEKFLLDPYVKPFP